MKKSCKPIKLALRTETITRLEANTLADVRGGALAAPGSSPLGPCTSRPVHTEIGC